MLSQLAIIVRRARNVICACLVCVLVGLVVHSAAAVDPAPAAKPADVFLLSSFEEAGPNLVEVKGTGEAVQEHATDGKRAMKIKSDPKGFPGLTIADAKGLSEFKNHKWLKIDVFNPQDAKVKFAGKIRDARSNGYNSQFNIELSAAPGKSTIAIDLTDLACPNSSQLDAGKLTSVAIFLLPGKDIVLFFDNVRLEGSPGEVPADTPLYDFETQADLKAWSNIDLYSLREAETKATIEAKAKGATNPATAPAYKAPASMPPKELDVKIELTSQGPTSGKSALKLTYAGGRMPTISAKSPMANWQPFKAFKADVTASRTCMVVFRVMTATSKYGGSFGDCCTRWEFAARCVPGKNALVAPAPALPALWQDVQAVQVYVYCPHEGESVTIDNIRLSTQKPKATSPFNEGPGPITQLVPEGKYKVLGTDLTVSNVDELADKLKDKWVKPEDKTAQQIEADVQAQFEKVRKDHPKAVLVTLRDGQKGYDPANPDKAFAGWQDAGTPSHPPMSVTLGLFHNSGTSTEIETCFRTRPGFLRCDLSSISKGANILAARLIVVRAGEIERHWDTRPTMFVAEPCNRPWKENEVTIFEYAKDQFWLDYGAQTWGDEGDCTAVMLAHGPSAGKTLSLDFTEAVKYWTDGKHANQGFILYGSSKYIDFFHTATREDKDVNRRPALSVIYEPK